MQFSPDALLQAVPPIPSHAILALLAAVVGAWQLAAPKGGRWHRVRGYVFVVTGLFTLWPGRIMHEVLFGPSDGPASQEAL